MNPNWFDRHWCYIGLAAAVVFLLLLFSTNSFRQRLEVSRWRDPVWLSWLLVPTLLIHQFEEYGFDASGHTYDFPVAMCRVLGYGLTHIGQGIVQVDYGPGLLTALLLFIPLSAWIVRTCFGPGRLRYQTLAVILLAGVLLHVVLIGSIQLVLHGAINGAPADAIQVINPLWLFVLPWAANKIWPPAEPGPVGQSVSHTA